MLPYKGRESTLPPGSSVGRTSRDHFSTRFEWIGGSKSGWKSMEFFIFLIGKFCWRPLEFVHVNWWSGRKLTRKYGGGFIMHKHTRILDLVGKRALIIPWMRKRIGFQHLDCGVKCKSFMGAQIQLQYGGIKISLSTVGFIRGVWSRELLRCYGG